MGERESPVAYTQVSSWRRFARRMAVVAGALVLDGLFLCSTVVFAGAGGLALVGAVLFALVAAVAQLGAYLTERRPQPQPQRNIATVLGRHHGVPMRM